MPVDGAREAAAFGLCSSFSRLIGQGEGGVQSFQSKGTHAVFIPIRRTVLRHPALIFSCYGWECKELLRNAGTN